MVELTPDKDATLYSYLATYDPEDPNTFPQADGVTHLHVGDTNNNKGVQRGLMQFDLSGIPGGAVVTDASLTLQVADVPSRVLPRDINFWLVAMEELSTPWQQGPGPGTGTGEQKPALPSDTTWFHTEYDTSLHGELGNTTANPYHGNLAVEPGHWPQAGYFGDDELAETSPDADVGGAFDGIHALTLPAGADDMVHVDDVVTWSNARMISDVQAWVDGTADNLGWIMVGEEWIDETHQVTRPDNGQLAPASCKIDFYSIQSAGVYYTPPILQVAYRLPRDLLPGDANGDDIVDEADATILAANWQRRANAAWSKGDFNDDGLVDDLDATILAANWLATAPASVPEASTLVLLVSGLTMLLWRRWQ